MVTHLGGKDNATIVKEDNPLPVELSFNDSAISVQNPFPTDGDSVYAKDIDLTKSSIGTFTGIDLLSFFNDMNNAQSESDAVNPKYFEIHFRRPVKSDSICISTSSGNFSNVKIELHAADHTIIDTIDDSTNDTKLTKKDYVFEPTAFGGFKVYFYTADPVNVSFIFIQKTIETDSFIKIQKPDNTIVNMQGTTQGNAKISIDEYDAALETNPLPTKIKNLVNGTYYESSTQYPNPSDGDSVYAKDIRVDESDTTGWTGDILSMFNDLHTVIYNDTASNPKTMLIHFYRTVYTNSVGFGAFTGSFSNLEIQFLGSGGEIRYTHDLLKNDNTDRTSYVALTPNLACNAIRLNFYTADTISISNLTIRKSTPVDAILRGEKPDGTFTDIGATTGGNLKVSVEEYDDASNPVRKDLEGGGKVSVGTSPVEVTFTGLTKHIIITADINNTGILYVGKSNIISDGNNAITFLLAGEDITLDYDDVDNALYVVSDTASQNFWKGSLL